MQRSIRLSALIIDDFPAYSVHAPSETAELGKDFVNIHHGDSFMLKPKGSKHWHEFVAGSAVGYALENNEDPIKAFEQCRQRGHKTHWINGCSVSLTAHKQAKKKFVGLAFGDIVRFEGRFFILESDWNQNVTLIKTSNPDEYSKAS